MLTVEHEAAQIAPPSSENALLVLHFSKIVPFMMFTVSVDPTQIAPPHP